MEKAYFTDQAFSQQVFLLHAPVQGEYEGCTFTNCDFHNLDISGFAFVDCTFATCNLSMAKIGRTVFRDVTFRDCKLWGLRFDTCSEFGLSFSFHHCSLNYSSFYQVAIRKTVFRDCEMKELDLSSCDLTAAVLYNCDLLGTSFDNTNLEKADLRGSLNIVLDPARNKVKKAIFSQEALPGLLAAYDIKVEP